MLCENWEEGCQGGGEGVGKGEGGGGERGGGCVKREGEEV